MSLFRRSHPPAGLAVRFDASERMLAQGRTATGDPVVATQRGLWTPEGTRIGWHQISKATWSGSELTVVTAVRVDDGPESGPAVIVDAEPLRWPISEPGRLPQVVQKRVNHSVALTEHHLAGSAGVRIVARRVSGRDGLAWFVRYDHPADARSPGVIAAVEQLLARVQGLAAGADDPDL